MAFHLLSVGFCFFGSIVDDVGKVTIFVLLMMQEDQVLKDPIFYD